MREFQQIKRGRDDTITAIEHQTIENIARVRMFNDAFMDNWIKIAPVNSVVVMHNHPRNGLFSGADLKSFSTYNSIYAMTAVCNDGTIYMMKKTEKFDPFVLMMYYSIGIRHGKEFSGIKNVAKNASKIGIVYRCSVKRR